MGAFKAAVLWSQHRITSTSKLNSFRNRSTFFRRPLALLFEYTNINSTTLIFIRIVYHTSWICRFSKRNKMPGSKNNKNCEATLSYKIKKICRKGYTDPFMSEVPPKPGILKIRLLHSHRLDPPANIDYMIWSQEMQKPVEDPSEDGSDSYENKVIKEEIVSDCEISEAELPDIYQLPLKRKSYHPHTRMGRPPLTTYRSRDASHDAPDSIIPKSDQASQTLSEESSSVTATTSLEANKSESTSDQPPKVNVFIFQVNPGTTPLIPNFEVKPGTTPLTPNFEDKPGTKSILPKFEVKSETTPLTPNFEIKSRTPVVPNFELNTKTFAQNAPTTQQNVIPTNFFYNTSQGLNYISKSDKEKALPFLFTNCSGVAQNPNIVKSESSISMLNPIASSNIPKQEEFILPVISTVTSQKSGESLSGSFSTVSNIIDPNNNPPNKLNNSSMMEEVKSRAPIKLVSVGNSLFAKPIRNPKLEDLELYKQHSSGSQEINPLEIDGEQYIPIEMNNLDIYGLHVAERLRKLDQKTREFVQRSIDGLLFDAEIGLGEFTYEKSQSSKSETDSRSTFDTKSEIFDSESTWSAFSDQAETCS